MNITDTPGSTDQYVTIVFLDGDEADDVFHMLYNIDGVVWSGPTSEGILATIEHLSQWDYGTESEHSPTPNSSWGFSDRVVWTESGYILAWNADLGYVSLNRRVREEA